MPKKAAQAPVPPLADPRRVAFDPLQLLPRRLVVDAMLVAFLAPAELCRLCCVSRHWNTVLADNASTVSILFALPLLRPGGSRFSRV